MRHMKILQSPLSGRCGVSSPCLTQGSFLYTVAVTMLTTTEQQGRDKVQGDKVGQVRGWSVAGALVLRRRLTTCLPYPDLVLCKLGYRGWRIC